VVVPEPTDVSQTAEISIYLRQQTGSLCQTSQPKTHIHTQIVTLERFKQTYKHKHTEIQTGNLICAQYGC